MKKFLQGTITGVLLTSTVALAATYVAEDASFKILVDGNEFTSSKAVVIDGSTYLPLRAIGDALNVAVNWNEELRQVEIGNSAPVAEANEYSRTNPAPLNTVQTYTRKSNSIIDVSAISPDYSAAIRVIETTRGENAAKIIKEANQFNEEAKEGYEYIIAKVAFSLLNAQNDVSINANSYNFDFYSSNNEEYESVFVSMDDMLSTDLYAGGSAEGYIVGMVKKDDASPKLAYGLDYNGVNGIWFSLQ